MSANAAPPKVRGWAHGAPNVWADKNRNSLSQPLEPAKEKKSPKEKNHTKQWNVVKSPKKIKRPDLQFRPKKVKPVTKAMLEEQAIHEHRKKRPVGENICFVNILPCLLIPLWFCGAEETDGKKHE